MHATSSNVEPLVGEYATIVAECAARDGEGVDWSRLRAGLVSTGDWTGAAAEHLIELARDYGTFVLRNALALAIALQIEDGEKGF